MSVPIVTFVGAAHVALLITIVYVASFVAPVFESVAVIVISYPVVFAGVLAAIVKFLPLKLK